MKKTQINLDSMITRVNNFGVAHAAAAQLSGGEAAKSGTDTKAVAFQWLHDDLMAIHETAATSPRPRRDWMTNSACPITSPTATSCPSPAPLPPMPRRFRPISSLAKCLPIFWRN